MSKLPVPNSIKSFQGININDHEEKVPSDGRVRTYAHERGQWSTHIYIKVENQELDELLEKITDCNLDGINLIEDIHITFIRGHYTLRHHQIDSFSASLGKIIEIFPPFYIYFDNVDIFENDEHTRCFLTLAESHKYTKRNKYVDELSEKILNILNEYNCDINKMSPKTNTMHCSLTWSLPEYKYNLDKVLSKLKCSVDEQPLVIYVTNIETKIGNLTKRFYLNKNFKI